MEADAGPVPMPESAPSSEQGPDPEEGARAEFAALHGPALRASGVPERYWGRLLHKLEHEVRAGARGVVEARGCGAGPGHAGGARARALPPGRVWSADRHLAGSRWGLAAGARAGSVGKGRTRAEKVCGGSWCAPLGGGGGVEGRGRTAGREEPRMP